MQTIVETRTGRVAGQTEEGLLAFLGIPYAAPPVGTRRFLPPQPPDPWSGVRETRTFGAHAPQLPDPVQQRIWALAGEQSEDCLTLNVWTPGLDAARRPVLVWLHGGAFVLGAARRNVSHGAALARRGDVVVVTLNYRLGALGWLQLDQLGGAELAHSGNHGLLDQIAALEWVRDHAAAFGGDPDNVTLFGESAGGISVSVLLASPRARGLFHKAIAQSGAANLVRTPEASRRVADALLKRLGTETLAGLQGLELAEILRAQGEVLAEAGADTAFGPVMDDELVPSTPLDAIARGAGAEVPLLTGTTRDEFRYWLLEDPRYESLRPEHLRRRLDAQLAGGAERLIAAYRSSRPQLSENQLALAILGDVAFRMGHVRLAEARERHGARTWMYLVTWSTPVQEGRLGAPHAIELPFVFGNLDVPNVHELIGSDARRGLLRDAMQDAWLAFARHGDPNHAGLPDWSPYGSGRRTTLLFDLPSRLVDDPHPLEREAWGSLPFDGLSPRLAEP